MFLSQAARCRCAASLGRIEPVRLKANGLCDVTSTLRKSHQALRGYRYLHVSVAGRGSPPHLRQHHQHQLLIRSPGRVTLLPSSVALGLRGPPSAGHVLFTGSCWSSSVSRGRTMQPSRCSSTSPSSRNQSPGQVDQNVKEDVTPSSADKTLEETELGAVKPSKAQQLKTVFKEYGAVGVSFHICISLMSLGMFYLLISSGLDMVSLLSKLGFSEAIIRSKMAAGTSTFVLAYAVHKLFAPVRISITLVSVPLIVRYLRKTGLFKPPTPAP
ncbi:protein FAM210B, mitochondrial [Synchiropus splendidus]|uniref:protein FAM210B, mitochondrial n=1 Tax=Synchiropus splendidus TaxID=270530 RepID=UPI00237EE8B9|nr:protein FAM210B, mitochondrial [Synchiropus splendidus]